MSANHSAVAPGVPQWPGNRLVAGILAAIFLLAAAAFVYALNSDATQVDFALLTVSFLYLMGITQGAIVFVAIQRLVGAQWSKPYYRLAEIATLAFAPYAIIVFLLIYFLAQDQLFYWLSHETEVGTDAHASPWLNINWLLARNLFALVLFYSLSAVYAFKAWRTDRDWANGNTDTDYARTEAELRSFSPYIILSFALCSTLFAWDFGMMLLEHWHSSVFPIFFSFGNLYAGAAALLFLIPLFGLQVDGSEFRRDQVRCMGMLITGFTVLWLYFFWAQFFVVWFGNLPRETDALWPQMYGHYAPYFWTMMTACFFLPFVALVFAFVKRSLLSMLILAGGINVGIWLHKYLTVMTAFSPDDTPFDHWLDIVLAIGLLAGFIATFIWIASRVPVFSTWEIARRKGAE